MLVIPGYIFRQVKLNFPKHKPLFFSKPLFHRGSALSPDCSQTSREAGDSAALGHSPQDTGQSCWSQSLSSELHLSHLTLDTQICSQTAAQLLLLLAKRNKLLSADSNLSSLTGPGVKGQTPDLLKRNKCQDLEKVSHPPLAFSRAGQRNSLLSLVLLDNATADYAHCYCKVSDYSLF